MAVCVKAPGAEITEDDVMALSKARLAGFKRVKAVRFTDVIPRNASGKILKRSLRDRYAGIAASE